MPSLTNLPLEMDSDVPMYESTQVLPGNKNIYNSIH